MARGKDSHTVALLLFDSKDILKDECGTIWTPVRGSGAEYITSSNDVPNTSFKNSAYFNYDGLNAPAGKFPYFLATDNWTIEAWYKPMGSYYIVGLNWLGTIGDVITATTTSTSHSNVAYSGDLSGWHHYAYVNDASSQMFTIYVDGEKKASGASANFKGSTDILSIGGSANYYSDSYHQPFYISQFRISDNARYTHNFTPRCFINKSIAIDSQDNVWGYV